MATTFRAEAPSTIASIPAAHAAHDVSSVRALNLSLLLTRVALGAVILPHGLQKTLGWFGGYGFQGTMGGMTGMGIPAAAVFLVILAESLGSLGLITGTLTRLSAFGIAATMAGAMFLAHLPNGFFMNWSGQQAGEGFEFHLLAIALALPLVLFGGGSWSVDRWLRGLFRRD